MDESSLTERRSSRSTVMLCATLEVAGGSIAVMLRNLSQDGALVCGDNLPDPGTRVLFHREGLSVPSRVAWLDSDYAGLAFDFALFPREVLRYVPPANPKPSPAPVTKGRPGFGARPLTKGELATIERWAAHSSHRLGD